MSQPTFQQATLAVDSRCTHGEGLLWCPRLACLYWIDISQQKLWCYWPGQHIQRSWDLPDRPGCLGLMDDDRLLVVMAKSIAIGDPARSDSPQLALEPILAIETDQPHTRSNDGRADRHGHLVFGTMDEHPVKAARGAFYQFSFQHGLRHLSLPPVSIPNSICFSPDGGTMYFCDSVKPSIFACDYDPHRASTGTPRRHIDLDLAHAEPDGSVVDADGYLWNAQWRAGRVVRYAPDGRLDDQVKIPAKNPTCPTFGGPQLSALFVISSRMEHSPEELDDCPWAGGLFQLDLPAINGLPESRIIAH